MSTTFATFKKIDGSDRFELKYMVTSPYETESLTEDTMVRDITKFIPNNSFLVNFIDEEWGQLLSFGTDNSVTIHPKITLVEYVNNQDLDPQDGINKIVVTCYGEKKDISNYSLVGSYFKNLYPNGYTAGGY